MAAYQGVEIKPGTDADVAAQVQAIDTPKTAMTIKPTVTPTVPITSLKTPVAPTKLTQPTPPVASSALGGILESGALANQSQYLAGLEQQATAAETTVKGDLASYLKNMLKTGTKAELKNDAYEDTVDPAKAELRDINNQILAEQNAARRAEQELRKNAQGVFGPALEQQIQDIKDKSIAKQADLSIIQMAKQGKYADAVEIADRAVEAKFEREKLYNEALKYNYEQNKDMFDKKEQRAFEAAQSDREMALQFQVDKEKAKYEQQIRQNDPLYKLQVAKAQKELTETSTINVPTLGGSPIQGNTAAITALLNNKSIGQGTRTALSSILGVINGANDLATANTDGKFKGVYPGSKIFGGIAGKLGLRSESAINNQGYLDAINLKVQQWASGASLTAQQIDQVNRLVPTVSDTDKSLRSKLNNLSNFMLTQTQSALQSEGVSFVPAKVDLFNDMAISPTDPLGIGAKKPFAATGPNNPLGL